MGDGSISQVEGVSLNLQGEGKLGAEATTVSLREPLASLIPRQSQGGAPELWPELTWRDHTGALQEGGDRRGRQLLRVVPVAPCALSLLSWSERSSVQGICHCSPWLPWVIGQDLQGRGHDGGLVSG